MNALILAAGLGTRLRPWTLSHPKALVPVGGIPMLQRVIANLHLRGFDTLTVNIHHFGDQIIDFLSSEYPDAGIAVSDERDLLMDTGGALRHAAPLLRRADISEGVLVHNVDILSDAPLEELMKKHRESGADLTLMVSKRDSSRALLWDDHWQLRGWCNHTTGERRLRKQNVKNPVDDDAAAMTSYIAIAEGALRPLAFSGIYVAGPRVLEVMEERYKVSEPFSIIDFLLSGAADLDIRAAVIETPGLIDIGKPDTLRRANLSFT